MGDSPPAPPAWVSLEDGERIQLRATPSTNLVLGSLAFGFVLLISMSLAVGFLTDLATGRWVSFTVLVFIVVLLVSTYVFIHRREYLLTTERACTGVGLLDKRVRAVDLTAVDDVTLERAWWHRPLNVGTIRFGTEGDGSIAFSLIDDPVTVNTRVLESVDLGGAAARRG